MAPHRSVDVAPDGSAYVMVPSQGAVEIYRASLGNTYKSRVPDRAQQVRAVTRESAVPAGDVSIQAYSRADVIARAEQMANTTWTWYNDYDWFPGQFFADGVDRARPTDAVKPVQLGSTNGTSYTGIPYTWGGFDSPWTRSDWGSGLWTSWSTGLTKYRSVGKRGPLVGKSNTTCGVYSENCWPDSGAYAGALGIDCSGFVAAASGNTYTSKPGTGSLMTAGYDVKGTDSMATSIWRVQPGDFFVSNAHTLYYDYLLLDGTGVVTLEATTDGSPEGAKYYSRTWSNLQTTMTAHRAWSARGTGDGPNAPFTTGGSGSACYSTRGQSVWYKFTVSSSTTVTLSGISGGDPDLYIYDSSLGTVGESEHAGTTGESVPIAPGTYYARVHIWSTSALCVYYTISW